MSLIPLFNSVQASWCLSLILWDGLTLAFNKQLFSEIISFYIEWKSLGYHKLVGQGYDGAATFLDIHNGV